MNNKFSYLYYNKEVDYHVPHSMVTVEHYPPTLLKHTLYLRDFGKGELPAQQNRHHTEP